MALERYPRRESLFDALDEFFGGDSEEVHALENFVTLMESLFPRADVERRAVNLPQ